jgi:hypothetical protein
MEETILPPKKKRAASGKQIEKELKAIYKTDENDGTNDFTTIVPARKKNFLLKLFIVAIALFAVAGIVWAGIMRFGGSIRYGDKVEISITATNAPRAGEVTSWTISYRNADRLPLARSEISLRLPASVTVVSSEPQLSDSEKTVWTIGTLEPGDTGTITVSGRVLDSLDAPVSLQAVFSYRPANFNSDFQKISNWSARIADSIINLKLSAPEETVPGDNEPYSITVEKRTDAGEAAALPDLKIRFDLDRALLVKSATPEFSSNDERAWSSAPPGEKPLLFAAAGSFSSNAAGQIPIRAEAGTVGKNGNFIILAKAEALVTVLPGDLSLLILRNGSAADGTIGLGETMHVSLDYENKSPKTITDVELSLNLAGTPVANGKGVINWATLNDLRGGKRNNDTIVWTKKEIPELASLSSGNKGSVDISFRVVDNVFTTEDRNYAVDLAARGTLGAIGGKKSGKTVSTPLLHTAIGSDARIAAAATSLNGPHPPKTNNDTTYRVLWVITNSLHEITGIKATAVLPANVRFAGYDGINVPAGELRYNDAERLVTWTLNRLPTSVKNVSVDFNLIVSPTEKDIGKTLPLLEKTTLNANDKDTGALLSANAEALTTNLDNTGGAVAP